MEEILQQAARLEKEYDWSGATKLYEKALNLLPQDDFSKMGELHERLGYAFYRFAFQAESLDAFRERIREAVANHEKTKKFYEKLSDLEKKARTLRCEAMLALMDYWLATDTSEKKKLLNECWKLTKRALEAFEGAGASLDYAKTYDMLSISPVFEFTLESDFQSRVRIMKETVECGEKAVMFLSGSEDVSQRARVFARTVICLSVFGYYCQDGRERDESYQKGLDYWLKAKELSEEIAIIESLYPVFGGQPIFGLEGSDEALSNCKKGLEFAKKTRDRFFIGCALDWLTYHTGWKAFVSEDKDENAQLVKTSIQYGQDARDQFSKISFISPRADLAWVEAPFAESVWVLAGMETDAKKKRDLLERAAKAAPDMLKKAEDSRYPEAIIYAHGIFSLILSSLTALEANRQEKKRLLEEALQHGKESAAKTEQLTPLLYWNRGMMQDTLARVKSELAEVAEDNETKKSLLQEAALARDSSLKLLTEELTFFEIKRSSLTSLFAGLGRSQSEYGNLLNRLYGITQNQEYLKKAVEVFREAIESLQRLNLRSRMAECCWKIAQAYDALDEHSNAAEYFGLASNNYSSAAEKIPQLKGFYQDYARYMEAWSEIEKARHHHERQEYGLAEKHFQNAANVHKSLKQWSYLAPNYSAWAEVEHAEELSRKDQSEEALQAFERATELFEETKKSIQDRLSKIEDADEKQIATQISNATDTRREYCKARIAIEEAKILDKKGDHYSSSKNYGSAAEAFERIGQRQESEQGKREIQFITVLSRAWQKMTMAEAEASPTLYAEASELFEQARDYVPNEKIKMLVLGHSRFCKALEEGTRFADTRDVTMHATATRYLESAANYYVSAGFQTSSEYAKATQLLFDAYAQMDNAKRENDPDKKAKLYVMAEKVLQSSAGSFTKAEHPEKRERVLRLLEKVEEERELALTLTEVLHAPSIVSSTTVLTTPTPTREEAVGSERFEHADIQANLIIRQKELRIGENLSIELELVNAGRGSALLTKVTGIIPKGFELAGEPEACRVEDSYINLKGKRLDPLKTEEVKLVLKPTVQGTFSLKPTVLYLDENGKYKSHEPEPVLIVVKELGIKSWLKGER